MVSIKICGLRRAEDIEYVNRLQPEYAGFVFAPGRRQLEMAAAGALARNLDSSIKRVGVFVDEARERVLEIAAYCGLDIIQLHGAESPGYCGSLGYKVWKAIRVKDRQSLGLAKPYEVDGFLLDTYRPGCAGGTGESFDWKLAQGLPAGRTVILAGGLDADNVREAVGIAAPDAVDVSSGVETDGYKDYAKMKEFIEIVRDTYGK